MQKQRKLTVLVVGGGGREHALCRKIRQSPNVAQVYCAPGNAGISQVAECVPIKADNIKALSIFARANKVDLTVVGPEAPLVAGIVDLFQNAGLRIFGPTAGAALLEGSKKYAKDVMEKYGIPTAPGCAFCDHEVALKHLGSISFPAVIKADGLAAGKGVIPCNNISEAKSALHRIMVAKEFGDAGNICIVEDFLPGEEVSFLAFTDGKIVLPLPTSQDHKKQLDGDQGPNTGGMGAYSPAPIVDAKLHQVIMDTIMIPIVNAMAAEGSPYKGVLYAGLMIGLDGIPRVLEFNARFGDPETQPVLMRLKTDVVEIMLAVCDGRLADLPPLDIDPRPAVCVVMASGGYPGGYEKGFPIIGLAEAEKIPGVFIFHAGTAEKDGNLVTAGGRVLGVTAMGNDLHEAIAHAYAAVGEIQWTGVFKRSDIAHRAL